MHNKVPENPPHTPHRYSSPLWQWMSKAKTYFPRKNRNHNTFTNFQMPLPLHINLYHEQDVTGSWAICCTFIRTTKANSCRKTKSSIDTKVGCLFIEHTSHHAPSAVPIRHHSSQTCFDDYEDWLTNVRDLKIKLQRKHDTCIFITHSA